MSNSFDVNAIGAKPGETREGLIEKYYWKGDHMFSPPTEASHPRFDQIDIFNTDSQYVSNQGATSTFVSPRGQCASIDADGKVALKGAPQNQPITCFSGNPSPALGVLYFEPPSGCWILNPSAKLIGNSVAGCQDTGAAYWYIPPPDGNTNAVKFIPIGPAYPDPHGVFQNNRGHGCYRGLIDDQFELSTGDSLFGYQNGVNDGINHPQVDEFDGLTLSRIRFRGAWLRPVFFFLKDARLATNRRSLSFVTSGGADGNYPGVWSLMNHSTMVGISNNNVDRFGPCGSNIILTGRQRSGGMFGCIDQTVPEKGPATGGEFTENGYPVPDNNLFGFQSYDGPPLLVTDRFVNFLTNPMAATPSLWTTVDQDVVKNWHFVNSYKHYEGDAAIGWLESNQSAYPTAASTEKLSFLDVDLRHQVYTDAVNIAVFNDGDRNTSILDLDGTLSGFEDADAIGNPLPGAFVASLNNLPFNASSNSVDEYAAEGQQNIDLEGRPLRRWCRAASANWSLSRNSR